MTTRIGNTITIEPETPQQCDDCGEIRELRPYGPNGSCICFECGMKDKVGTRKRFEQVLLWADNGQVQRPNQVQAGNGGQVRSE
jgi:hypothetical protein